MASGAAAFGGVHERGEVGSARRKKRRHRSYSTLGGRQAGGCALGMSCRWKRGADTRARARWKETHRWALLKEIFQI
jgi:hypothetical protein